MSEENTEMQWYVLRTIGGKEKKVKESIDMDISRTNLKDFVAQVLIPTERFVQMKDGKKITKERISYPGYILIQANLVEEIPYTLVDRPNVLGFLSDSKESRFTATPLRISEVHRLLGRVDELAMQGDEESEIQFIVGESVKVIDGPFSSFLGTVEEIDNARKKLTVSVKIFGRKTPMELSFGQVEKE